MNAQLIELIFGKRYAGFLITVAMLLYGYLKGGPDQFSSYAATLGLVFGAYAGAQTATDMAEAKKGP